MIISFNPDIVLNDNERKLANTLAQQEISDLKECIDLFKCQLSNTALFKNVNADFIVPAILDQIKDYFVNSNVNNPLSYEKELEVFESYSQRYDIQELIKLMVDKK